MSVHTFVPGRTYCWTADSNVDAVLSGTSTRKQSLKRILKFLDFKPTLMLLQKEMSLSTYKFRYLHTILIVQHGVLFVGEDISTQFSG